MKDKKLKRLRRSELLELLLEQRRLNEELEKELAETKADLDDRTIRLGASGNIAEASLKLTEIFEEAQKAADLYLENIRNTAGAEVSAEEDTEADTAEDKAEAAEDKEETIEDIIGDADIQEEELPAEGPSDDVPDEETADNEDIQLPGKERLEKTVKAFREETGMLNGPED